jgi:RNA polymerase sigma-70 factor (ECF subfamily)
MRSELARGKLNVLSEVALNRNDVPVSVPSENQIWLRLLIQRAVAGDTAAFEQIMIHSQQKVMTLSWRLLGNEADASDASQEVFLRIYRYLGRFKQDQEFFAWVYQITVNVCRDIAKKRQRHTARFTSLASLDIERDECALAVADQQNADESMIAAQQRELIAAAMATLPAKEHAAIVLRDIEGLPTDEVARILRSTQTTVRSQISSARRKIKIHCERYLRGKAR